MCKDICSGERAQMKDLRDLKDLAIHDVQPISEYNRFDP